MTAAAAVLSWRASSFWIGDYPSDAGPVIDKLIHGDIGGFLSGRPLMGPVSLVVRAPFAALSLITGGGGASERYDNAYRFGVFPCALAAGVLAIVLYRWAERTGRPPFLAYVGFALCLVNPVSVRAIDYGHPEEILAAVLVVGAMLAALADRGWLAAVLLGLAVATKQWAFLAIASVLVVVPWQRVRMPMLVAGALIAVVAIPLLAVDPGTFLRVNGHLLDVRSGNIGPGSIWWLVTHPAAGDPTTGAHHTPAWLGLASRPAIVAISVIVPLVVARHVRQRPLERALPMLALVLLLRSMLDPVNNSYYHVPFFLALVAADVLAGSMAASLTSAAALLVVIDLAGHATAQGISYAVWATGTAIYLAARTYGVEWLGLLRTRGVRDRVAAPQVR